MQGRIVHVISFFASPKIEMLSAQNEILCPLGIREFFLEVAKHLSVYDMQHLQPVCTSCAESAGDVMLATGHMEYEAWLQDFQILRRQLEAAERSVPSASIRGRFQGSLEAQYCRRRVRMQQLVKIMPEVLQTWNVSSSSSFRRSANMSNSEDRAHSQGVPAFLLPAQDLPRQASPRQRPAFPQQWQGSPPSQPAPFQAGHFHLPCDMFEIMVAGPRVLHCGPVTLFDRFDRVTADPYHEVELQVELLTSEDGEGCSDSTPDSDDEPPRTVRCFSAALSEWGVDKLEEVQQSLVGKLLTRCPEDPLALQPLTIPACGEDSPVVLVQRGESSFANKMRNASAGGAAGVIICNQKAGPLFRMAGWPKDLGSEGHHTAPDLLQAVLVSLDAGKELHSLLDKGTVRICGVDRWEGPCEFLCFGAASCGSAQSGQEAELWVVADHWSSSMGQVLWVPPVGPAVVLANSLFEFIGDLVRLDLMNAKLLSARAPYTISMLHATGEDESGHSSVDVNNGFAYTPDVGELFLGQEDFGAPMLQTSRAS